MYYSFRRRVAKHWQFQIALIFILGSFLAAISSTAEAQAEEFPALPSIELGASVPSDYSYCATIINYDPANTYTFTPLDSSGVVGYVWHFADNFLACVSTVNPGDLAVVDLAASRDGFASSLVRLSGRSLGSSPIRITFSNYERTADGFIVEVTPRSFVGEVWTVYSDAGQARLRDPSHIEVSGLLPGESTLARIYAELSGYYSVGFLFQGSALTTDEVRQNAEARALVEKERARLAAETVTNAYLEQVQAQRTKAAEEAEAKRVALLNSDLSAISKISASPSSASPTQVQKLTPNQVSLIGIREFRKLPVEVFTGLSAQQAAGLTAAQVKSLTIPKLTTLSPAAIGSLKPEALGSLSVAKLRSLTKAQVAQIWLAQLLQLDPDQRKALRRRT